LILKETSLARFVNIEEVFIHNCGLTSLPPNIFASNLLLSKVSLRLNLLTSIPLQLFTSNTALREVYVILLACGSCD
jgi:hypothetical protein